MSGKTTSSGFSYHSYGSPSKTSSTKISSGTDQNKGQTLQSNKSIDNSQNKSNAYASGTGDWDFEITNYALPQDDFNNWN